MGHATATTPVLPVPLTGPAYFVSHGGEAFPSLIIVLQGYGVTVHLVGTTFISKAGITSSTFKTVPDVPVGTFELTLPEGPFSALAANGNLCKTKLAMPTEFVGQNGALIKTSTKIAVTGCPQGKKATQKHKQKRKAQARAKERRRGRGGRGRAVGDRASVRARSRPRSMSTAAAARGGVAEIQRARMIAAMVEVARRARRGRGDGRAHRGALGCLAPHVL